MNLLAKQAQALHKTHPKAALWVAPQGFTAEWLETFLQILDKEQPQWLTGVVFGPQVRISLPELRALVPARYPIRHYPDITHSRECQYPPPSWDAAYALTEGREGINPRPLEMAQIGRRLQPFTSGSINTSCANSGWPSLGVFPLLAISSISRRAKVNTRHPMLCPINSTGLADSCPCKI